MIKYIWLIISATVCVFNAQANVICEENFIDSSSLKEIRADGTPTDLQEPLNSADYGWGPWEGYRSITNKAVFVGNNLKHYEFLTNHTIDNTQPIWFSITVDLQSSFSLLPLGSPQMGYNLAVNFDKETRLLGGISDEVAPESTIKLSRIEQYLLVGRYQFTLENRTRLQLVAIPSTQEIDLSQELDFDNTDLPVYVIENAGQPSAINSIRMVLDSGSLIGNLRVGTDYADIIGYVPPPVVVEVIAPPVVEESSSPILFIIGGVVIVILIGGVLFALTRKKSAAPKKKDPQAMMAAMATAAMQQEEADKKNTHNGLVQDVEAIKHHNQKSPPTPPTASTKQIPAERAAPKFIGEEIPQPKQIIEFDDDGHLDDNIRDDNDLSLDFDTFSIVGGDFDDDGDDDKPLVPSDWMS